MNKDINLVSGDSINVLESARVARFRALGTYFILAVGILSVLLFVLNKLLSPQPIVDEQNKIISSMTKFNTTQVKLSILSQRLNDSTSILTKRTNYDLILSQIISQSPSDVVITSLSFEKKKVSLIVSSLSLLSLNSFIDSLKGLAEKKQYIKTVTVNNLNLGNAKTGYTLNLDIDIL